MECKQEKNKKECNCTYNPCSRNGICCNCIKYHLRNRELPACCFPDYAEKTFNRSFEYFANMVNSGKV